MAVGEQSIVADAVQALGEHVRQEAPNELAGWQGHGLIAVRPLDPVILPLERDAGFVGCDQPAIGDGDAVGVAYPTYKRIARKPPTCEGVSPTNADDVLPPRRQGTSLCPSTA